MNYYISKVVLVKGSFLFRKLPLKSIRTWWSWWLLSFSCLLSKFVILM